MVQIIQQPQRKNFGQQFAESVGAMGQQLPDIFGDIIQKREGKERRSKENEALKRFGIDLSDVEDPDLRKTIVQNSMKQKASDQEKFSTGLNILDEMQSIVDKGDIGFGSQVMGFFGGDTARQRSEFEQLGKSLIPIVAAGVPIRNQREFDEYKKVITNPSSRLSEIQGAINGLRKIFDQKLTSEGKEAKSSRKKMKFNPKNPEHISKFKQLDKQFKSDRKKVNEALAREFEA